MHDDAEGGASVKYYVVWDASENYPAGEYGPYIDRVLADTVADNWPVNNRKNIRVEERES